MNCRVCNEPGAQHEMVDHDLNGDKKGTCFKCVVKQRDNLRNRYARLAASMLEDAMDHIEEMGGAYGFDHPEVQELLGLLGKFANVSGLKPTTPTTEETK